HDPRAELHVPDDLTSVGEAKEWPPVVELCTDGKQGRNTLRVEERAFVVDEVEAAIATDAGELEVHRVDRGQSQRLDGRDRDPDDLRYGYSTSTWMRFFASFRNPPSR